MYGASIEQDFPHIAYERAQLKRTLEIRRLLAADQPRIQRPQRSLATIFGRLTPRFDARTPRGQSSAIAS